MVGFTYRRVPAIALARQLVAGGPARRDPPRAGAVPAGLARRPRVAADLAAARRNAPGSGALGDIGAHIIDLTQFVTGERITGVSATTETFVTRAAAAPARRTGSPAPAGDRARPGHRRRRRALPGAARAAARSATFEATRFATGRKNALRIEVNGSRGSLAFDFEDMNVLQFYDATAPAATAGFRRILVTEPEHPYVDAWWPAGHVLGYEHGFTHQAVDLVDAIARGADPAPSFADGLHVQRVLAAVEAARPTGRAGRPSTTAWTVRPRDADDPDARRPTTTDRGARTMTRPITLFTGQWADLPFEEVCRLAADWGYDGLEIACWGDHFEVDRGAGRRRLRRRAARDPRAARPRGLGDLQPPRRPGRLRRPDRRAAPRHPAGTASGATATPRACASAPPRR